MRAINALAAVPLIVGLSACGGGATTGTGADAQACTTLPTADPAATLPPGYPARDQVLYGPAVQGKTVIVFGLIEAGDFLTVRDDYVDKLKAAGWTIDGTDQESVEAEAQFSKPSPLTTGTIKVQPLCKGYVTVRYKLNQ